MPKWKTDVIEPESVPVVGTNFSFIIKSNFEIVTSHRQSIPVFDYRFFTPYKYLIAGSTYTPSVRIVYIIYDLIIHFS